MSTEWFYTKRSLGGYIVYEDWDKPICVVNDEEHARIIIAAPEMLEALEAIEMALAMGYRPAEVLQEGGAIRNAVKSVITKSKGEDL